MDVRGETPIRSFSVAVYICRVENERAHFLILKRRTEYLAQTWQMVSGKLEAGERAWEAAVREMKEETGLAPDRFYSADDLETFYEVGQNCINIVPIFLAFVGADQTVRLSPEHDEFRWVTVHEAARYLCFEHQVETMYRLEERFVRQEPMAFLEIRVPRAGEGG